jgi:hypothetical protein
LFFGLLGKELEEDRVLSESARSRKDLWGPHMPLVCPDGAVVAYAWKRQLAGQAGASAVDRSRFVSALWVRFLKLTSFVVSSF